MDDGERGRYLSEEDAAACLVLVRDWIEKHAGPGWEPALYGPGHEGDYWNVSLEGAVDEWPWRMSTDESVTWPDGVWVEPGSSWYLALHCRDVT